MPKAKVLTQEIVQIDPAEISGDLNLNRQQLAAYMTYHGERNRRNSQRARELGVVTSPIPLKAVNAPDGSSPSRVMVSMFLTHAAERIRPWFVDRPITVVDLGCGSGVAALPFLEAAGMRGRYIGLDIAQHKGWDSTKSKSFTRELIVADVHTFDPARLPEIDLLVSVTSLEHIKDDLGAIRKLESRLAPVSAQVHYVPGEAALPLYGAHGWRQYSPACLRGIFPHGELLRTGGACSSALHLRAITRGGDNPFRARHPFIYKHLRKASLIVDRMLGNTPAGTYGVIVMPRQQAVASKPELRRAG